MIHYHGTPITPRAMLLGMAGRNFCVSLAAPSDLKTCLQIGQSVMLDNGAFSTFTRGEEFSESDFYDWIEPNLGHPHWAVVPDVIGGTEEQQRERKNRWPFPKEFGAPVWHLGLSFDYLFELVDEWPKICIGSSAEYWNVGSQVWCHRMDETFNALHRRNRHLPWIHGLRMLGMSGERWPLASADSVNVGRNWNSSGRCCPEGMARKIDAVQCPIEWTPIQTQQGFELCL